MRTETRTWRCLACLERLGRPPRIVGIGNGAKQQLRIWMRRSGDHLLGQAAFDDRAVLHDAYVVGNIMRRGKIMRYALAVGGPYLAPAETGRHEGERWLADNVCDGAIEAIERLRTSTDQELVRKAGAWLAVAKSVLAFGSGGSSSMAAVEMQNRLFRLGIQVTSHIDGQMQRMTAAAGDHQTVLVVFSISGAVRSQKDAVWVARQYGAKTIAITAPGSELARGADLVIPFNVQEDGGLYRPSSSRFALLAVVDMLAIATAEAIGPRSLEILRRIKQNLNVLQFDDPRLPIGD